MAPYIRMETPETSSRFLDGSRVTSPETYRAWQAERLFDRGDLARAWPCDLEVPARIEHGRWVVTCVNCINSVLTHPEWRLGCCAECGCVMRHVVVPADADAIVRVLLARPRRENQSWLPGETLADLEAQNVAHGVAA